MKDMIRKQLRAASVMLAITILPAGACMAADAQEVIRLSKPVEQTAQHETFGSPLDESVAIVSLQEIANDGARFVDQEVRLVVRVAEVCQKKGCFFFAQEGDSVVRVSFKDYGFFVPTDIGGKRVTLVGEVVARDITPDEAEHYAEDLGKAASPTGAGKSYEIVAISVRLPRGS